MKRNKAIVLSFLVVILMLVTTACSKADNGKSALGSTTPSAEAKKETLKEAPTEIKILTTTYAEAPSNDLESIKKINEKLNVKLTVQYEPTNNYPDKLNALLAANELPDVTLVWDQNVQSFANAIKQGAFWDLTPLLKNYPNLSKYPENAFKNLAVSGKNYGIARVRPMDGHEALVIRKDWLDKLGLQAPKTLDDLYKVMEAFTKNDPDGNGKADTYGLASFGSPGLPGYNSTMFGTGQNWTSDGQGGIQPSWWTSQQRQALEFWAKAYKAGILTPDLPIVKQAQIKNQIVQGKAGMEIGNINEAQQWNVDLKKANPQANLVAFEIPAAMNGKTYYDQAFGSFGLFMINKKVPEAKVKKILEVYDYAASLEGSNLVTYGIKGTDYTESTDGFINQTDEGKKKGYGGSTSGQWISGFFNKYARADIPGMSADEMKYNRAVLDKIEPNSKPDLGVGIVAPTWLEKGADWTKKKDDQVVNSVIGKASLEDWDKFVKSFKDDPAYQKYVKEMNDGYKEKTKK